MQFSDNTERNNQDLSSITRSPEMVNQ